MSPIIRASGTIFNSILYVNSGLGFIRLKYEYPVISVMVDSLPANTIMGINKFVTARVRFLASWAEFE